MPGGLLRYGIPNFKLDKAVIDRRMKILEVEGILFKMGVHVDVQKLPVGFDAYAICTGTPVSYTHLDVYKRQEFAHLSHIDAVVVGIAYLR